MKDVALKKRSLGHRQSKTESKNAEKLNALGKYFRDFLGVPPLMALQVQNTIGKAIRRAISAEKTVEIQSKRIDQLVEQHDRLLEENSSLKDQLSELNTEDWCDLDELSNTAWHEAGHVIGGFIAGITPTSARIRKDGTGVVISTFTCKEQEQVSLAGGYALPRKYSDLQEDEVFMSLVLDDDPESDWELLGKPSMEELNRIADRHYQIDGLYPLAKKVHDLLMEKMKLDKDDLATLKGDFDDLQAFNQKQILLFPDQSP